MWILKTRVCEVRIPVYYTEDNDGFSFQRLHGQVVHGWCDSSSVVIRDRVPLSRPPALLGMLPPAWDGSFTSCCHLLILAKWEMWRRKKGTPSLKLLPRSCTQHICYVLFISSKSRTTLTWRERCCSLH